MQEVAAVAAGVLVAAPTVLDGDNRWAGSPVFEYGKGTHIKQK